MKTEPCDLITSHNIPLLNNIALGIKFPTMGFKWCIQTIALPVHIEDTEGILKEENLQG